MDRIATFHVVRERPRRQLVVMARMLGDRWRLRRVDGLVFAKVLGTGRGEDTGPSADLRRQAYFLVWESETTARRFLESHELPRRWRRAVVEHQLALRLLDGHGTWSGRYVLDGADRTGAGRSVGPAEGPPTGGRPDDHRAQDRPGRDHLAVGDVETDEATLPPIPQRTEAAGREVVVLTRARIRLRRWRAFRHASRATASSVRRAAGLRWSLGVGELPVGLLGTVSCWRSADELEAFLAADRVHSEAATHADDWFVESLFARFAPTDLSEWDRAAR